MSDDFVKHNARAKEVKRFPNNDAMILELMSGGADAVVVLDSPLIANFMQSDAGKGKVAGDLYMGQSCGIGFTKGSSWCRRSTGPRKTEVGRHL